MKDKRLPNLLGALGVAVQDVLQDGLASPGMSTPTELAALVTVANHPEQPIDALHRTLRLTHSGAVRVVDRLEASGLLTRARAGYGRTLALTVTQAGRAAVARIRKERLALLTDVVGTLTEQEQRGLVTLVERLLAELTTDRASARRICRLC